MNLSQFLSFAGFERLTQRMRIQPYCCVTLLVLAVALPSAANTIYVTTTQQGVTDANNCSLQEAIYSADFDQSCVGALEQQSQLQTQ